MSIFETQLLSLLVNRKYGLVPFHFDYFKRTWKKREEYAHFKLPTVKMRDLDNKMTSKSIIGF